MSPGPARQIPSVSDTLVVTPEVPPPVTCPLKKPRVAEAKGIGDADAEEETTNPKSREFR